MNRLRLSAEKQCVLPRLHVLLAHLQQFRRASRKKFPVKSGSFQVWMSFSDPILVPKSSLMPVDFKVLIG